MRPIHRIFYICYYKYSYFICILYMHIYMYMINRAMHNEIQSYAISCLGPNASTCICISSTVFIPLANIGQLWLIRHKRRISLCNILYISNEISSKYHACCYIHSMQQLDEMFQYSQGHKTYTVLMLSSCHRLHCSGSSDFREFHRLLFIQISSFHDMT